MGGCVSSSDWDLRKETSHEKYDHSTCRPCLFLRHRPRPNLDEPRAQTSTRVKSQRQQTNHRSGTRGDVVFKIKHTIGCSKCFCKSSVSRTTRSFTSGFNTNAAETIFDGPSTVARARRREGQSRARCVAGRYNVDTWNSCPSFTGSS